MKNWSLFLFVATICTLSACNPNATPNPEPEPEDNVDTILKNISYGIDSKQKMDIYLPKGRSSMTKVIILIHGGAWSGGDKNEMGVLIPKIQAEWPEAAIVNINYRLANGSSIIHTQITEDLKAAVNFIVENKAVYKISDDMGMIGASAGAHLALLYSYQYNEGDYVKAVSNIFGPSHFADWEYYNSFNVFLGGNLKEVYKKYVGVYWDAELYESLSPYHIVNNANYIPTITFHGNIDVIVPIYQNQWFQAKLNELDLESECYEYAGEGHGFSDAGNTDCVKKTVAFFKANM